MSHPLDSRLNEELCHWEQQGRKRTLTQAKGRDFTTNDYFSLSRHPEVIQAAQKAIEKYGAGTGAARLLRGNLDLHEQLEAEAAQWQKTEAALLFPSGYQANLALLATLPEEGDVILSDERNHASIIDGCRLSKATCLIYQHNSLASLQERLNQWKKTAKAGTQAWIVTERVFSMDADLAPITEIIAFAEKENAFVFLDEAHAAGVYPVLSENTRCVSKLITGGKALGVCGALLCTTQAIKNILLHRGRSFVFTTAPSPATTGALLKSVQLLQEHPQWRKELFEKAHFLRKHLQAISIPVGGEGAIIPIRLGDEKTAMSFAEALQEKGFDIRAVRPPTVPTGDSQLRIVCKKDHSEKQLLTLAEAIGDIWKSLVTAPLS